MISTNFGRKIFCALDMFVAAITLSAISATIAAAVVYQRLTSEFDRNLGKLETSVQQLKSSLDDAHADLLAIKEAQCASERGCSTKQEN